MVSPAAPWPTPTPTPTTMGRSHRIDFGENLPQRFLTINWASHIVRLLRHPTKNTTIKNESNNNKNIFGKLQRRRRTHQFRFVWVKYRGRAYKYSLLPPLVLPFVISLIGVTSAPSPLLVTLFTRTTQFYNFSALLSHAFRIFILGL